MIIKLVPKNFTQIDEPLQSLLKLYTTQLITEFENQVEAKQDSRYSTRAADYLSRLLNGNFHRGARGKASLLLKYLPPETKLPTQDGTIYDEMLIYGFVTPNTIDYQGYIQMLHSGPAGLNKRWNQRIQELNIPQFPISDEDCITTEKRLDQNTSLADYVYAIESAERTYGQQLKTITPSETHESLWSNCPLLYNGQYFTDGAGIIFPKQIP